MMQRYENLSKEIEFQTLEIELCEKKIREFNAAAKQRREDLERAQELINDRSEDLAQKKSELDEIISETKQEEEKLREKAKQIEGKIEERLLNAFKRIRKNARNGLAVVAVERDACGGCFNKIPPQRQLDIRLRKKIIVCEYCGRILIDQEMASEK
jgi:predicted  nucleic acid-binding Zn-ribbon protein